MKYTCAYCTKHACHNHCLEKAPSNCPSLDDANDKISTLYQEEENYAIANASSKIVMDDYGNKTRLKEIIDFAKEMGYKRLGLAFCVGLSQEANIFNKILIKNGFQVESLICKIGSIDRQEIGIKDCDVPMCNPIAQAKFLNKVKTDFNIVLGLCVGHDTLFFKYSEAPVTVFAVKDRVLAHNPLGAIYLSDSYYEDKI